MEHSGQVLLKSNVHKLGVLVNEFVKFYQRGFDYQQMIYDLWNAKDVLGHIVFWHESFAKNISDLGENIKPTPLKGKLSEVNERSVASTKQVSIDHLLIRLQRAQEVIEKFIYNENIALIPYRKGSRDYSREEHVQVCINHINRHLTDLEKKYSYVKT